MHTPSTFDPPSVAAIPSVVPSRLVTDAPTRMFHWLFALSFVGAYLTADGERWRLLHVTLGYTMAGLLGFRLLYGIFGPRTSAWACCGASWQGHPHGCAPCPRPLRSRKSTGARARTC